MKAAGDAVGAVPRAAPRGPGGEERFERASEHLRGHPRAVVGDLKPDAVPIGPEHG